MDQLFDLAFLKDFLSNAIATVLGVVLGIPAALWISRWQERATETRRKRRILRLLQGELLENFTVLNGWFETEDPEGEARVLSAVLRNESWQAFSDGGELEWIRDPSLLDSLSNAYYGVRSVRKMSDIFTTLHASQRDVPQAANHAFHFFRRAVEEAIPDIEEALRAIGEETEPHPSN